MTYDADEWTFFTREQTEKLFGIYSSDDRKLLHDNNFKIAVKDNQVIHIGVDHYELREHNGIRGYAKKKLNL